MRIIARNMNLIIAIVLVYKSWSARPEETVLLLCAALALSYTVSRNESLQEDINQCRTQTQVNALALRKHRHSEEHTSDAELNLWFMNFGRRFAKVYGLTPADPDYKEPQAYKVLRIVDDAIQVNCSMCNEKISPTDKHCPGCGLLLVGPWPITLNEEEYIDD